MKRWLGFIFFILSIFLFISPAVAEDEIENPLVYISDVKTTRTVTVMMKTDIDLYVPVIFEINPKNCKWLYGYSGSSVYIEKINKTMVKFISPDGDECEGFLR